MWLNTLNFLISAVYLLSVQCETLEPRNMAHQGIAWSTGYSGKFHPSKANDGNYNTMFHSNSERFSSWFIDLRTIVKVDSIYIHNRPDCCWERLVGAKIELFDDIGNKIDERTLDHVARVYDLGFNETELRMVKISQTGVFLSFSDVDVIGVDVRDGLEEMAVGTSLVSSSGALGGYDDSNAVDGTLDTLFHSNVDEGAWWEIDFGTLVFIRQISIHNRNDCCTERFRNATISILDLDGNVVERRELGRLILDLVTLSFPDNPRGLSVRIDLPQDFLHFREIEVYGGIWRDDITNIALHKPATDFPNVPSHPVGLANDGIESTYSHSNMAPNMWSWWEVDLQRTAKVRELNILNRQDCCQARLNGAWVNVLDSERKLVFRGHIEEGTKEIVRFNFPDIDVRYVKIEVLGAYLHLAEVQVYGYYPPYAAS